MQPKQPSAGPAQSQALRTLLTSRYWYLTLQFTSPETSESGRWEATWNGGRIEEDTEPAMLSRLLEEYQDCGDAGHQWQTTRESIDGVGNVLMTQQRVCVYCDPKERTIIIIIIRPDLRADPDPAT